MTITWQCNVVRWTKQTQVRSPRHRYPAAHFHVTHVAKINKNVEKKSGNNCVPHRSCICKTIFFKSCRSQMVFNEDRYRYWIVQLPGTEYRLSIYIVKYLTTWDRQLYMMQPLDFLYSRHRELVLTSKVPTMLYRQISQHCIFTRTGTWSPREIRKFTLLYFAI